MKRALILPLIAVLLGCGSADPTALAERQWQTCETELVTDQTIEACSAVIADRNAAEERRAGAFLSRGVVRANLQQRARALADLGRALRSGAGERALVERGLLHHDSAAYDAALADFDAALELNPETSDAFVYRNRTLEAREDAYYERLDDLDVELGAAPDNADLLNARCWLRATNGGDLSLALEDCEGSLRIAPNDANVLDSRGLVRLKRGEFAAALADYEAALVLTPGRGHYLYGRGLAQIGLGREAEGRASLAAGEAADPNAPRLYLGYGVNLLAKR